MRECLHTNTIVIFHLNMYKKRKGYRQDELLWNFTQKVLVGIAAQLDAAYFRILRSCVSVSRWRQLKATSQRWQSVLCCIFFLYERKLHQLDYIKWKLIWLLCKSTFWAAVSWKWTKIYWHRKSFHFGKQEDKQNVSRG